MRADPPEFAYPASWKDSFAFWWRDNRVTPETSENCLLKRGLGDIPLTSEPVPHSPAAVPSNGETRSAVLRKVQLSGGKNRFINTLEIGRGERSADDHNLVLLHGYGGGIAFSFQNLRAMSSVPGTRLYALDWLGQGLSGRPHFPRIRPKGTGGAAVRSRVQQAENFSIDALEEWRQKEGLQKMTLMGHSLGGYLSAAYALKYPERVHKLILLSPVGVPEAPYELPDASDDQVSQNIEIAELASQLDAGPASAKAKEKPPTGMFARLWDANLVSPFSLVRLSSFAGPKLVSRYAAWRYSTFPNEVQKELFSYLYLLCQQKGSGEYTLPHLLSVGVYGRWPLMQRLKGTTLPITFIYGDHDWMRPQHGYDLVDMLKKRPRTPENELQQKRSRVVINEHAGHWVFLENPEGFNRLIEKEIKTAVKDHPVRAAA